MKIHVLLGHQIHFKDFMKVIMNGWNWITELNFVIWDKILIFNIVTTATTTTISIIVVIVCVKCRKCFCVSRCTVLIGTLAAWQCVRIKIKSRLKKLYYIWDTTNIELLILMVSQKWCFYVNNHAHTHTHARMHVVKMNNYGHVWMTHRFSVFVVLVVVLCALLTGAWVEQNEMKWKRNSTERASEREISIIFNIASCDGHRFIISVWIKSIIQFKSVIAWEFLIEWLAYLYICSSCHLYRFVVVVVAIIIIACFVSLSPQSVSLSFLLNACYFFCALLIKINSCTSRYYSQKSYIWITEI